jgi:hypothetical protein
MITKTLTTLTFALAASAAFASPKTDLAECFETATYQSEGLTRAQLMVADAFLAEELRAQSHELASSAIEFYDMFGFNKTLNMINRSLSYDPSFNVDINMCVLAYHQLAN